MSPATPTLTDAYRPSIGAPLAGSHLFFVPSLFVSQTMEGKAGIGLEHRGQTPPFFCISFDNCKRHLKLLRMVFWVKFLFMS